MKMPRPLLLIVLCSLACGPQALSHNASADAGVQPAGSHGSSTSTHLAHNQARFTDLSVGGSQRTTAQVVLEISPLLTHNSSNRADLEAARGFVLDQTVDGVEKTAVVIPLTYTGAEANYCVTRTTLMVDQARSTQPLPTTAGPRTYGEVGLDTAGNALAGCVGHEPAGHVVAWSSWSMEAWRQAGVVQVGLEGRETGGTLGRVIAAVSTVDVLNGSVHAAVYDDGFTELLFRDPVGALILMDGSGTPVWLSPLELGADATPELSWGSEMNVLARGAASGLQAHATQALVILDFQAHVLLQR